MRDIDNFPNRQLTDGTLVGPQNQRDGRTLFTARIHTILRSARSVSKPTKKLRNADLSAEEKADNQQISSGRIYIEHAIEEPKRYRYLVDRMCIHMVHLYELLLIVCADIWNFYLTN